MELQHRHGIITFGVGVNGLNNKEYESHKNKTLIFHEIKKS